MDSHHQKALPDRLNRQPHLLDDNSPLDGSAVAVPDTPSSLASAAVSPTSASASASAPHPLSSASTAAPTSSSSAQRPASMAFTTPSSSAVARSRSTSVVQASSRGKRLSLQFPIQPTSAYSLPPSSTSATSNGTTTPGNAVSRPRPQSWISAPATGFHTPELVQSPLINETNFFTVLASQERRVLELKEELAKAESELSMLKNHWANHEASKSMKREVGGRRIAELQPLDTALANLQLEEEQPNPSAALLQKETERRRSLITSTRTPQRKVFTGSRHARTLSLLSPQTQTLINSPVTTTNPLALKSPETPAGPGQLKRASTAAFIGAHIQNSLKDKEFEFSNIQKEALLRTGKQMATDLKEGIWTFIEDLRQATVGDEAVNGTQIRSPVTGQLVAKSPADKAKPGRPLNARAQTTPAPKSSRGSLLDEDISEEFWKEHGLADKSQSASMKPKTAKDVQTPQKPLRKVVDDFEESWETWDTPNNDRHSDTSGSTCSDSEYADTESRAYSGRSSVRTSTSSAGIPPTFNSTGFGVKRDGLPWAGLNKLSPVNLKKTATQLMNEWEKSVHSPPEARDVVGSQDYMMGMPSPRVD